MQIEEQIIWRESLKMAASSRKRYHILLSSFSGEEKAQLSRSIQELGGTYFDTPHFLVSCSHVICGRPSRGEKFLCGCAAGKWILKREFIEDSVKAGKWLEEELYEWNEQSTGEGVSTSHMASPARWRRILEQKKGPFKGWKALVAVADAKKRAAYKRLLEVGGAVLVSGKPPYPSSLASKLTHVFVEKALEDDVQALQNAGVQCLSPDYIPEFILQDPAPCPAVFFIASYKSPVTNPAVERLQRTAGRLKNTPVLGSNATESRIRKQNNIQTLSTSEKTREPPESSCTSESPNKKQNQEQKCRVDFSCVDRWKPVSILNASVFVKNKVCTNEFPEYIMNSIDGYLEESHQSTVLDVISTFMTSKQYPPPSLLRTIIDTLQKPSPCAQATKAFLLLQQLLVLHPPHLSPSLYQSMLNLQADVDGTPAEEAGCVWELLKTICSKTDQNSLLLLRFVITLLERDFYERANNSILTASEKLQSLKQSLLWRMVWKKSTQVAFNMHLRELVRITWTACENPNQILVLQSLQSIVVMTSQCYILSDLISMKCTEVALGTRLSERSRTFVIELACGGTHCEATMKRFLETCSSTWLRMHVADMLLANYTDLLVPLERRHLKSKTLSLEKIVSYYFFLVPSAEETTAPKGKRRKGTPLQEISKADINKLNGFHNSSNVVSGINRRNIKGETKLHVACIKNEAEKVKQLLAAGADANSTDHAGWTPLHEACNHGHVESVRELLKARQLVYEINPGDDTCRVLNLLAAPKCGTTPLHDAVGNNHLQVAELLVSAGGLPLLQAKNARGEKPLNLTTDQKIKTLLQTLKEKNAVSSFHGPLEKPSDQAVSKFILILSHLVQSYLRVTGTPVDNPLWINFKAHIDNLEGHVIRMLKDGHLSSIPSIRLAAMKMLANS